MTKRLIAPVAVLLIALGSTARGEVRVFEKPADDGRRLVLESDRVQVVVWPAAGGAITDFVNRRTGTNFVAGEVERGESRWGWKDLVLLTANAPASENFASLPYEAEMIDDRGKTAIRVWREEAGYRVERTMQLDERGQLTIHIRHTNTGDEPRRLWLRWHPYTMVGDPYAEHSAIFIPGPGEDGVRKIRTGIGWDDWFYPDAPYWLAGNWESGEGLWMTYDPKQVVILATWTDYAHNKRHDMRGAFTAEPWLQPVVAQPGESVEFSMAYYAFTADDRAEQMPLGQIAEGSEADQAAARQFLERLKPGMAEIGDYTMVSEGRGGSGAIEANRFYFSHRRRDRMALHDWGVLDSMLAVGAVQETPIRLRYYTQLFENYKEPLDVRFVLTIRDALGKVVKRHEVERTVDPAKSRVLDERDDVAIADLPDGWYTVQVEGYVGDESQPIHTYTERRKLIGERLPKVAAEREAAIEAGLRETPFVRALREVKLPAPADGVVRVPIGVEEAGGIARTNWPVRVGVPLEKGAFAKTPRCRVVSPAGEEQSPQATVMGTWLDGSVKWLLVEFQADVPASEHVFYELVMDGRAAPDKPKLLIEQREDEIAIDAGKRRWSFSAEPQGDDLLLGLVQPEDIWWENGAGQTCTFALRGKEAGIVVEENGPERAVVVATGWYYGSESERPIARGELRMEVYRGQSHARLYHTATYLGDPWHDALRSYGIRFRLELGNQAAIERDGRTIKSDGPLTLHQHHENVCTIEADNKTTTGRRTAGAAALIGDGGRSVVYHRDLWRLHPKQVDVKPEEGTIAFWYWPREAGAMSYLPREDGYLPSSSSPQAVAEGMSRTHEFIIEPASETELTDYEAMHGEPVLAVVPPRYLCGTGAMLHLKPFDPAVAPDVERQIQHTFDAYLAHQDLHGWYGEWTYGALPNLYLPEEQRWADFGRYAWILNEQDIVQVAWLAYLRSGDRTYYRFAEANTRHMLEVATIRHSELWPEYEGLSRRHHECIWLSTGDMGHSMLDPFVEMYHVTGYRPAWDAAVRMANAYMTVRDGTWRYVANPMAGLARMYTETQEPLYKLHADRIWKDLCAPDRSRWWYSDHGSRMALHYAPLNPMCAQMVRELALRDRSTLATLDIAAKLYEETGEARYAEYAAKYSGGGIQYQAGKDDPMMVGINTITQHVLAHIRELCYATETIEAGRKLKESSDKIN